MCIRDRGNGESNIKSEYRLGELQFVPVENNILVCNFIGQRGTSYFHGIAPVRYEAFIEGFYKLKDVIVESGKKYTLIMPRIGCSLAGGSWSKVENIINKVFNDIELDIVVYTYGEYNE